jgi:hypothetical protein
VQQCARLFGHSLQVTGNRVSFQNKIDTGTSRQYQQPIIQGCCCARIPANQSPMATGGESAQILGVDYQGHTSGHLEVFGKYLAKAQFCNHSPRASGERETFKLHKNWDAPRWKEDATNNIVLVIFTYIHSF